MRAAAFAIIRMYPAAWRQRYADEMREVLSAEKPSLRTLTDLLAGAIDARLSPQPLPARAGDTRGDTMMKATLCNPAGVSTQDQMRSAAWMVGGSLFLTVAGIVLKLQIGPNALTEGLMYSAFPAALMLSSECTYLKRYSRAARMTIAVGGAAFIVLMTWAAVAVGNRI